MTPVIVFLTDKTLYVTDLIRNRLFNKFVLPYTELDVILVSKTVVQAAGVLNGVVWFTFSTDHVIPLPVFLFLLNLKNYILWVVIIGCSTYIIEFFPNIFKLQNYIRIFYFKKIFINIFFKTILFFKDYSLNKKLFFFNLIFF